MENMGEKEILEKLERKGVKPTANRILVLKALRWISPASFVC